MDPYGSDVDGSLGPVAVILLLLFYVAIIGFGIYMVTRVAKKAGYPWGYGLLYLIPVVNLVILVMFVFSKWPVERELEQLRAQAWAGYGQGGYPQTGYPQAGYPQAGASGTHPAFGSSGGHPAFGAQPTYGSTTPTYGAPGAYPASGTRHPATAPPAAMARRATATALQRMVMARRAGPRRTPVSSRDRAGTRPPDDRVAAGQRRGSRGAVTAGVRVRIPGSSAGS
jgi:hypothetical protein